MSIASMTGFARAGGELHTNLRSISWVWEIKSVNGKALDIKTRLPAAMEDLALEIKNIVSQHLQRGSVSVFLELQNTGNEIKLQINEALLAEVTAKALRLCHDYPELEKPRSSEILAMRGVVEVADNPMNEEEQQLLRKKLLADFEGLCQNLNADRRQEGAKIKSALQVILCKINTISERIAKIADAQPAKIKAKLEDQIRQWTDPAMVNEERLAQEVVFFVTRADIREEVDRLMAHVKTAAQLLESSEAVGRRLDFLCQELNREANTTCSKSNDVELTSLGMDLKALIEQFREQVQNIE